MHLRERLENLTKEEINQAYVDIFTGPKGSIILDHLAHAVGLDMSSYAQNPQDMAYNEGKKAVVLAILQRINLPVAYFLQNIYEDQEQ